MVWSTLASRAIFLTIVGTVFKAVGFSVPFWVSFVQNDATGVRLYDVFIGIWYLLACKDGNPNSCSTATIAPDFDNSSDMVFTFPGLDAESGVTIGAALLGN